MPGHAFVIWDNGVNTPTALDVVQDRIIEGHDAIRNTYHHLYPMDPETIERELYLKNLGREELLAHFLVIRGSARAWRGDWEEGCGDFDRAIGLYPSFAEDFASKAHCFLASGDIGKAVGILDHALNIAPDLTEARLFRSVLHIVPDLTRIGVGMRTEGRSTDARTILGATWRAAKIGDDVTTGPRIEMGYGTNGDRHLLDLSAGWAVGYLADASTFSVDVAAGYNFGLTKESTGAPIDQGALLQYGVHYRYALTVTLGIGAGLIFQHPLPSAQDVAFSPSIEFTYSPW